MWNEYLFISKKFQLRLGALNEPYTGDVHGVSGADYSCYREARRAGLRGTFRAFLSSRVQNVDSIVRQADRKLPVSVKNIIRIVGLHFLEVYFKNWTVKIFLWNIQNFSLNWVNILLWSILLKLIREKSVQCWKHYEWTCLL